MAQMIATLEKYDVPRLGADKKTLAGRVERVDRMAQAQGQRLQAIEARLGVLERVK